MEVLLLGTGAPSGRPTPGCACASCLDAAAMSVARAPTGVLVDDLLLIDPGVDAALTAARAGRSLAGVRLVLRTDDRPLPPLPAGARGYGPTLGPPADRARPGQRITVAGYQISVVATGAAGSLGYAVTATDGTRLLYAPAGAAPDPRAVPGGGFDVALLDVFGSPGLLGALRAAGAVRPDTIVLAAHVDHRAGPEDALRAGAARWGCLLPADGQLVRSGTPAPVASPAPRRTLVLGGASSGKSAAAEHLLLAEPAVRYVATGGERAGDPEWRARVAAHQRRRPAHWRTLETTDLAPLLSRPGPPLLVDCLSLWLTAVLEDAGAFDEPRGRSGAADEVSRRVVELVEAWRQAACPVVAVSSEVGGGVVPATSSGRRFRDALGRLNARLAAESERVLLTVAGQVLTLRGE
jgi:adenosylcobinamide kinase/adenosylcobinamide-phosphate guanylyltransferase